MASIPPDPGPDLDLDEDWHALGKSTPGQLAWQEFRKNVMDLVNRFFAWLDGLLRAPFRLVAALVVWLLDTNNFIRLLSYSVMIGGVVGGGWMARETLIAPDVVSHCSIQVDSQNQSDPTKDVFVLKGHRNWRPDSTIRRSAKFKVLQDTAAELGCPIR